MNKQDRQAVRTAAEVERKYNLGGFVSGTSSSNAKLQMQVQQLSQMLSQYMATTNALLANMSAQTIVCEVIGKEITLTDSSNQLLRELTLYGKTTSELVGVGHGGNIIVSIGNDEKTDTLTVPTPGGLYSIAVSEGGNYTDADGQQWICDEINFALGLKIQRIGVISSYAWEDVGNIFISSTGDLIEGARVIYPLEAPIETDLTADEEKSFSMLHTYLLNTTISNDAECDMKIGYVADIKAYIDNKIQT